MSPKTMRNARIEGRRSLHRVGAPAPEEEISTKRARNVFETGRTTGLRSG
jgi:hypothetical protein